jgi:hypothetical protein
MVTRPIAAWPPRWRCPTPGARGSHDRPRPLCAHVPRMATDGGMAGVLRLALSSLRGCAERSMGPRLMGGG